MARRLLLPFVLLLLGASAGPAAAAMGPCVVGQPGPRCHVWTGKATFIDDGDTIDVDVAGDGSSRVARVRMIGVQAMELSRYSKYADRRRGQCHGVAAADRVEQLVRRAKWRVRLAAQDPSSRSGARPRRLVALRIGGQWVDLEATLLREGHVLWLPHQVEWATNAEYRALSQDAEARGVRLWDPTGCGAGPQASVAPQMDLKYDADHNDFENVNGEWVRITNPSDTPLHLAGWWFRDSALRRYTFPAGATVPAHGAITLHMGRGTSGGDEFFWGLAAPPFENPTFDARSMGDGGYLFDPRGNLRASFIYPS